VPHFLPQQYAFRDYQACGRATNGRDRKCIGMMPIPMLPTSGPRKAGRMQSVCKATLLPPTVVIARRRSAGPDGRMPCLTRY
jgi:hypothetical protein